MDDHDLVKTSNKAVQGSDVRDEWSDPASSNSKNSGFYAKMSSQERKVKLEFSHTSRHKA